MDSPESFDNKLENLRVNYEEHSPGHEDQARAESRASLDSDDASWVFLSDPLESSTSKLDKISIRELWSAAYEKLRHENAELITDYEAELHKNNAVGLDLAPASNIRERMKAVLKNKMNEVNRDAWKLKFMSSELQIKHLVQPILGVVSLASGYIADGTSLSPCASLAWAGISVLLPLFVDCPEQGASLAKDLEYVSSLVVLSRMREELYIRRCENETMCTDHTSISPSHGEYKATLAALCQCVLKFQAHSYRHFSRNAAFQLGLDATQWDGWGRLMNEIREQELAFSDVVKIWSDEQYAEECFAAEKRHQETVGKWFSIGTDTSGLRRAIEEAKEAKENNDLIGWICNLDPSSSYNAALDKHVAGTNKWFVEDNQEFKAWKNNSGSLLWLHGKVGSGKSVLSSSVIKHLEHQYATDSSIAIAYFYFDYSEPEKQDVEAMLSSLIRQISTYRPRIPVAVKELSKYKHGGGRPDVEALKTALAATLRGFSAVYIVIDALDECPVLGGKREELLQTLREINTTPTISENLHLFCTSRKELDIDAAISPLLSCHSNTGVDMAAYYGALDNDIRQYIDSALVADDYASWSDDTKAEVKEQLAKKADGMFQYVNCQLDALRNLSSSTLIHKALGDPPAGLDTTYDRMLSSIDKNFQPQVINSLKWLAFSFDTFSISLLSDVFILRPKRSLPFDEAGRIFFINDILKHFSGLLVVNNDRIRLAHSSIKEYLTSSRINHGPASAFSFTEADAHLHIAKSCLAYHLQCNAPGDINFDENLNEYEEENLSKLKTYAAQNWPLHLEMAPRSSWPLEVSQAASLALAIRSRSLYSTLDLLRTYTFSIDEVLLNPLMYTAFLGASQLTEMLVSEGFDTCEYLTQGDLDAALMSASSAGSIKTIQLLLDKGAGVDAKNAAFVNPLIEAAQWCHLEVVRFLIENEAVASLLHVRSACSEAMSAAAREGNLEIVEFLVRSGAKVDKLTLKIVAGSYRDAAVSLECLQLLLDNSHGIKLERSLTEAALKGNWKSFELLLSRGADINVLEGRYGTPLHAACAADDMDESRIEYLLNLGADPKIRGGQHGTALQAVCFSYAGRDEKACIRVAKLLMARGVGVNEKGGEYDSALKNACASKGKGDVCWYNMVELLLKNGADVNAKGGSYDNALQVACHRGNSDLVPLLLDWGADVNTQGGTFGTALHAACFTRPKEGNQGDVDMVQLLLDRGADVNAPGERLVNTALQAACLAGNMKLARLLLDHGARVDIRSRGRGTALQFACQGGHTEIVRLLLDHGADVNALGRRIGGNFKSAIQTACSFRRSNAEIVHLLLDHGADIHAGGKVSSPVLYAAATSDGIQDNTVLKRLLELGADINETDEKLGTVLHGVLRMEYANKNIKPSRIRFLVEHGADVNLATTEFSSALHHICADPIRNSEKYPSEKAAALLLEICPQIDVNAKGGSYGSALQAAAWSDQVETVRLLIKKGAHVNAYGGKYKSALNAGVFRGYWHIVKILLDNGAKPDFHWREYPDEEWLAEIAKEDDERAVERYRTFWEVEKKKL